MVPAQCCWCPEARQMKRCGVVMCGEDGDSYEGEMVVLHSLDTSPAGRVPRLVRDRKMKQRMDRLPRFASPRLVCK
ncbi:hypothetical protein E2C01_043838 [Portunus trituberculatus]|uniref:Uncharacterized protein n=1 Tax=Portunus trituberculatus TaxID=210409 RepID=A0A5B7FXT4_PORTR|nr:hypothetical protein [Portunus trituberculatus]